MNKFVIRPVASGFKFDLYAPNGEAIATSEVYDTRAACRKGLESVRKNAPAAKTEDLADPQTAPLPNPKFELFQDKTGGYRFRLRSRNGKIIAASERYSTRLACTAGIESVRKNAENAPVEEPHACK